MGFEKPVDDCGNVPPARDAGASSIATDMAPLTLGSNIAALDAQRRLAESTTALSGNFERLSSGLRINKASDDAAGLSVAADLHADAAGLQPGRPQRQRRHQLPEHRRGGDGVAQGRRSSGSGSSPRSPRTARSATPQRQALDKEFQALVDEYNRVLPRRRFQGQAIFAAENATLTVQAGYGQNG